MSRHLGAGRDLEPPMRQPFRLSPLGVPAFAGTTWLALLWLALLALALSSCGSGKSEIRSTSTTLKLTGRVVDRANLIDSKGEEVLIARLANLERRTTDQFIVVTVTTLGGKSIETFSEDLANRWGIGRADVDNGILLVVAPAERQVRIAVGMGLEGLLTDERAALVIRKMLPLFRAGRMQDAIALGEGEIERVLLSDVRRPQPKLENSRKAA
jgi:uncharacterized protein